MNLITRSLLAALIPVILCGQTNSSALITHGWRQHNERAIVDEYIEFLSIPNVTRDHEQIQRNAQFLLRMMEKRGVASRLITMEGANPIVTGTITTQGASRTIAFYAHYDGKPVSEKEWATPPFTPTLRGQPADHLGPILPLPNPGTPFDPESRLYARASGDDKSAIMAMMAAIDAIRATGQKLRSNILFVFEGEEEADSPHLAKMLAAHKGLFAADLWLICDGPLHQTRRPLIYFGSRDAMRLDLTVYGPRVELHSGHYGNWAPNPAMFLARLLASMKDENGHVTIDHFYDDIEPLSDMEKHALAEAPDIDKELMSDLWIGSTEGAPKKLVELITLPALNITGLASSHVGNQSSNVIPATAEASIDVRLVKGMNPDKTQERIIDHIRRQGFYVVDTVPSADIRRTHPKVIWVVKGSAGLGAVRTPMDLPISQEVIHAVESVRGLAVKLPNMGGKVPLAEIEQTLGTRTIVIPIANHDDNQHSFNENLRMQNLWDGIDLMSALLTM